MTKNVLKTKKCKGIKKMLVIAQIKWVLSTEFTIWRSKAIRAVSMEELDSKEEER